MVLDNVFFGKPSVIGAVQGMITGKASTLLARDTWWIRLLTLPYPCSGLVAITPAAGVVAGWGAIIMGIASGSIPWFTMNVLAKRVKVFTYVDDTLGVFHTHAVAGKATFTVIVMNVVTDVPYLGFVGGMLTGVFATDAGCVAFACINPGGKLVISTMVSGSRWVKTFETFET